MKNTPLRRLISQHLLHPPDAEPGEVVRRMGAMQAQDLPMSLWAVGIRTKNTTASAVISALDEGKILRTHLMRPTWHLVSPEDIRWMLKLTGPLIRKKLTFRDRQLGLTPEIYRKSNRLIEEAAADRMDISRAEIAAILESNGIPTGDNRLSHILMGAELDGILCSGRIIRGRQNFALLERRAAPGKEYSHEEMVGMLAERYFLSHGPATLADFGWWSGLPASDLRTVPGLLGSRFSREKQGDQEYFFPVPGGSEKMKKTGSLLLLPAYDEFLIAYRDRSLSLTLTGTRRHVSVNGIFYPVIVLDGQVVGFWKKKSLSSGPLVETEFLISSDGKISSLVEKRVREYLGFLGKQ